MIATLYFLIFFSLIYFHGRGIYYIFYNNEKKVFLIPINLFYPLISLFFVGNLTVIFNFFLPSINIFFQFILLIPFIFNLKSFIKLKVSLYKFIQFVLLPSILGLSSLTVGLSYDAGSYQLSNQLWIREENIPIGLFNLNFRYGYSSIIEYISANFWLENNFILLHFVNIIFITVFIILLFHFLIETRNHLYKRIAIFILIFGFLDNFGLDGGRNGFLDIEAVTKQDTPFAILFLLAHVFLIELIKKNKASSFELTFISLLILFTIQMRVFGLLILFLLFYVILKLNIFSIKTFVLFIPSLLLGIVFSFKNILISGCMFFPIELLCFDALPWYAKGEASLETISLNNFHIGYDMESNIYLWFQEWLTKPINKTVFYNFCLSLIVVLIFRKLVYKKWPTIKGKNLLFLYFYLFVLFTSWIISAPGIRFGLGLFLLFIVYQAINISESTIRFKILENKMILIIGLLLTTALMPRLDNYRNFINDPFREVVLEPVYPEYTINENYGVSPLNGDLCWVNRKCIRYGDEVKNQKIYETNFRFWTLFLTYEYK